MTMSAKPYKGKISAKGAEITVLSKGAEDDFISLTDIAKYKNSDDPFIVINNWMRLRNTIEYLGIWEQLNNLDFNPIEFDRFLHEAGANAFTLSPQKWVTATGAIGITSKSGRYGGNHIARTQLAAMLRNDGVKALKEPDGKFGAYRSGK
jgi:hypothetical protein